ncbi:restriction endonuclease subunit S [uncultured Psychromonas sp.]|uniref:restriction endonuclease subunit S n=1 Tax=uncultured Psychromonas sp. TaxID=173974 RepID=UPI00261BCA0B|nr:restriction endonuclease subunit S [uncultured Psychromonas sp.]
MSSEPMNFINKPLGDCLELVIDHRGKTPRKLKSDWVSDGIPTISAKNVNSGKLVAHNAIRYVTHDIYKKWMPVDVARGDCFLVSEGATLGHCLYWDEPYRIVLGQRIFCLRSNPEVLYSRYLYAYMNSVNFQSEIIGRSTGSSVAGLRQTEVLKLNIKLPSMSVQKTIGDTLYYLNKKTESNTQTNQTLEEMTQAIFKSWFVDFDPVKAKIRGEQPEGMDAATAALFPNKLVESELGLIPEGWDIKSIKDFGKVITGNTPPKKVEGAYSQAGVPFITPTDIDNDTFVTETKRFLSESGMEVMKKNLLPEGSICITCIGSQMGKAVIAPSASISNQQINSIVTKNSYERNFLFLNLRRRRKEIFLIGSSGSTMPIINKSTFEKLKIVSPTEYLLKVFDEAMSPLLDKIHQNSLENQTLSALRDTLLPKLLSGEIAVDKDIIPSEVEL